MREPASVPAFAEYFGGFPSASVKQSWGEIAAFYNRDGLLPNGVYFSTVKLKDGPNDRASQLDRDASLRWNIGIGRAAYAEAFGAVPKRPAKGMAVDLAVDFTQRGVLQPHPVYAWMGWVCICRPTLADLENYRHLADIAHAHAKEAFARRLRTQN